MKLGLLLLGMLLETALLGPRVTPQNDFEEVLACYPADSFQCTYEAERCWSDGIDTL